tara:strand:- start:13892 stop:14149 length:258 start_codon:yes stop_codon:yes gene_type:complete
MNKTNTDKLKLITDHDLDKLYGWIKSRIQKLNVMLKKTRDYDIIKDLESFQIEYCYVKRELDARSARRRAHIEYLENFQRSKNRF